MKKSLSVCVMATSLLVCLEVSAANAALISGNGDPLTNAALTGGTQETFDSVADGLYNSLNLGNVTFTGIPEPLTVGTDFNGQYNTTGGKSLFNDFDYLPRRIRFDFLNSVTAFAFNFGASDKTWRLEAFDSSNASLGFSDLVPTFFSNNLEYFGLSASQPIAYALLTDVDSDGDYVFIDRFTTNGTNDVPLPAALPLLMTGLGGLAAIKRRRKAT